MTNHGGCAILNEMITYPDRKETRKKFQKTGITLIALVITIIVMLILVAVTISMAINGGLFEKAGKATGDTKNAMDAEQQLADGRIQIDGKVYESIDDYLAGKEAALDYDKTKTNDDGTLKSNAKYESDGLIPFLAVLQRRHPKRSVKATDKMTYIRKAGLQGNLCNRQRGTL